MADGFLGRWSRRKLDVKEGRPVEAEPVREAKVEVPPQPSPPPSPAAGKASEEVAAPLPPPPPTLEDAHALTPTSDFTRFVKADVSPEVKNAAMKKLFSDPHFNVMDGLDVYIDDYGKPDPIPESMMRQLVSGRFLGLFRDEEREEERKAVAKDEPAAGARDGAEMKGEVSVAQSGSSSAYGPENLSPPAVPPESDADPDLRLQQDDAAGPAEAGRGTG